MKKLFISLVTLLFCLSCSSYDDGLTVGDETVENINDNIDDDNDLTYNLLFIGNSLTYFNAMPNMVEDLATAKGIELKAEMIAYGNYGLEDHWNDGEIQQFIESKRYDFVIIQQGPSSQEYGRHSLLEFGGKISELCRRNNTKLAYYMVWPSLDYYHTFQGVIDNYTAAAAANDDILCPVGLEWRNYFDSNNNFHYYGPDGFHPSRAGSQVAAEIILESLEI